MNDGEEDGLEDLQKHAETYCQENNLLLKICFEMPVGYEAANGMYEPENQTLFINQAKLKNAPAYETLFTCIMNCGMSFNIRSPNTLKR